VTVRSAAQLPRILFTSQYYSSNALPAFLLSRLYEIAFGILVVALECKPVFCSFRTRKVAATLLKALTYLVGRGVLYIFLGTLLCMHYPNVVDLGLASYMIVVGSGCVLFGWTTQKKLATLSHTMTEDEKCFKEKFDKYDEEKNGTVTSAHVVTICEELGSRLSHHELEAAVLSLDVSTRASS